MERILQVISAAVWGVPLLMLILGVGIWFTALTGFSQITLFPTAIKRFLSPGNENRNNRRALYTALAATVGTGNLAGVAGAICIGGPGAVFWMWVCGIVGMIIKFAEATLAIHYRKKEQQGETVGGPMYMILRGLPQKTHWLAYVYCFFGVVAAFGVGNATQVNAAVDSICAAMRSANISLSGIHRFIIGCVIAILVLVGLWSGSGKLSQITEKIVPVATVSYLLLGCGVLIKYRAGIIPALETIVRGAFCPQAVTGGVVVSAFLCIRTGASRGVFTNEAGMGTAAIAHASAEVKHPAEQGLMGLIEVFVDTILICTMTALVILCSGVQIPYGTDPGVSLTSAAFASVYGPSASFLTAVMVCCFGIATVLGWSLYGGRCAQFLFGQNCWRTFALLQSAMVVISAVMQTETVWLFAEIVNGLMAIPNLIALTYLSPVLFALTASFKKGIKKYLQPERLEVGTLFKSR